MNWQKLYNPTVISLLHSPLHRLLDGQTMTMTMTGRKSGRSYTFPVSYVQDGANLLVISQKDRNLVEKSAQWRPGHCLPEGAQTASQR